MTRPERENIERRGSIRRLLTLVSVVAVAAVAVLAACDSKPTEQSVDAYREKSPTLKGRNEIRIGVRGDVPHMFYLENGERSGFEVQLAIYLAEALGFPEDKIEWVEVRSLPQRLSVIQSGQADISLGSITITDDREDAVDLAGPYLLVPQRVLVRRDVAPSIRSLSDLATEAPRICTTTGSTSAKALTGKSITPQTRDTNSECMAGMRDGSYDAWSGDLPILAGLSAQYRDEFSILDLTIADQDERIGVALPNNDKHLQGLVAYFLNKWYEDGRDGSGSPWLRAYDQTIGRYLDPRYRSQPRVDHPEPPDLQDQDALAPLR